MWTGSVAIQMVPAPPEDALFLQVDTEEEARRLAQELHTAHISGAKLCGSYLATAIFTKLAAESA